MNLRLAIAILFLLPVSISRADWTPPSDNTFTESELTNYIAAATGWINQVRQTAADVDNSKTDVAKISAATDLESKLTAIVASHHLTRPEYDYLAQRCGEAYGAAIMVGNTLAAQQKALADEIKSNDTRLTAARQRLAAYQSAAKDGRRVMSTEDRAAAVKSAKDDQQSALDEQKQREGEAKAATDEAIQHDAEAKVADAAAANPPAEMSADDRPAYIDAKTTAAQSARDAANPNYSPAPARDGPPCGLMSFIRKS